ncbi:ABC-type Fe3+-hydroxamate transport system substrate-binding protein [Paenibacillus phyllosphaerae]|uniref:ABC-type Fe3+-hydroxamate transport system substrate-binding protein n=1 Tax=Paenibacillus phyllosphaerae TaxID=274593 RepID=A0A7W5FPN7_9BACL|nr:AraC family transcriptional regulator [Paenibacillus phyllosphaerae]MBB3112571.1 ABC-type Fe3+-hydroxamate transport system substrate-binding protein [Paenibacillus phyllosphaerae]
MAKPYPFEEIREKLNFDSLTVRLRGIEGVKGAGGYRVPNQLAATYVFIVIKQGEGWLTRDSRSCRLTKGGVYCCAPEQTFGIECDPASEMELTVIRFDLFRDAARGSRLERVKGVQLLGGREEIIPSSAEGAVSRCEEIRKLWHSGEEHGRFRSQLAFMELLYRLVTLTSQAEGSSHSALERTRAYMEAHASDNLTIDLLAKVAELSPKYFADLYKKTYGISVMDEVTRLRISKAKQLMLQSDLRLRDIAHEVGYSDEFYFSRRFKQEVGVSPSAYIQSRRRKIAAFGAPVIGHLLALGIMPYAAPLHPKWTGYYYRTYGEEILVHLNGFRQSQEWEENAAALEAAKPDLIVGLSELTEEQRNRIERIAPVFYIPEGSWREQLLVLADFLGETAEANRWLAAYERTAAEAADAIRRHIGGERVLAVRMLKNRLYATHNRTIDEVLFGDLQVEAAVQIQTGDRDVPLNVEKLSAIGADRILMMVCHETETLAEWKALQADPRWQSIPAVRLGHVHMLPSDPWREYSPIALERAVREARALLT